jgi:hypothetical protein
MDLNGITDNINKSYGTLMERIYKSACSKCSGIRLAEKYFLSHLNMAQFLIVNAFHIGGNHKIQDRQIKSLQDTISVPDFCAEYMSDYIAYEYWKKEAMEKSSKEQDCKPKLEKMTIYWECWYDGIEHIRIKASLNNE